MQPSILIATKEILGLDADDDAFDLDITTHLNTSFSTLHQLGITAESVTITNIQQEWDSLSLEPEVLNMVRSYVFLKTQFLWDPPTTGFLITARKDQIAELEWRLSTYREEALGNAG